MTHGQVKAILVNDLEDVVKRIMVMVEVNNELSNEYHDKYNNETDESEREELNIKDHYHFGCACEARHIANFLIREFGLEI